MPTIRRHKLAGAFIAPMGPLHVSPRYTFSVVVDLAKDPLPSDPTVPKYAPAEGTSIKLISTHRRARGYRNREYFKEANFGHFESLERHTM